MKKSCNSTQELSNDLDASKEHLDRILAVGRILTSVLTEEEKKELALLLSQDAKWVTLALLDGESPFP